MRPFKTGRRASRCEFDGPYDRPVALTHDAKDTWRSMACVRFGEAVRREPAM